MTLEQIIGFIFSLSPGIISWGFAKPNDVDRNLTKLRKQLLGYLRNKIGLLVANELPFDDIVNPSLKEEDFNAFIQDKIKDILKDDKELFIDYYLAENLFKKFRICNQIIRFIPCFLIFFGVLFLVSTFIFESISIKLFFVLCLGLFVALFFSLFVHEHFSAQFKDLCDRYEVVSDD